MSSPTQPIVLHRFALSGHSHRVQLFLSLLGLPHRLVDVDLPGGEHKRAPFLELNPFGQVPVIEDDGAVVADSNAILCYLAARYGDARWLPRDPVGLARVQRWLSVAAGPLASGPARARAIALFKAPFNAAEAIAAAQALFGIIERHLAQQGSAFLTADWPTLADVALYSYSAHAPEGGVALIAYPRLQAWLARIEALPGFVPMASSRVGLRA